MHPSRRLNIVRLLLPWINAYLPGGQQQHSTQAFDIDWIGLPVVLLIGPDRTILASRDELSRETIETTLAKYLR
jgi:hypothetical protein